MSANGRLLPSELSPIAQGQLAHDAAAAWNSMNVEARAKGVELLPNGSMSSYRTYAQQVHLHNLYTEGRGELAAIPGTSNHGWGLAVDLATQQMRTMLDGIGHHYDWAKEWSDAQSEWWHIKYRAGVWSGPDPGPYGNQLPAPTPLPIEEGEDYMITAVVKQNGAIELFLEKADGSVYHTWQTAPNNGWWGAKTGQAAAWQNMNAPK